MVISHDEQTHKADETLPVHVSIATIPSRIESLKPTLQSLLDGTRVPDKIYVVHPAYCKWERSDYNIPEFLTDAEWHRGIIEHVVCAEDWGPSTKIMGVFERLPALSYLVIADDDVIYDRSFLQGLINAQDADKSSSFSYYTYRSDGLTIATGCDGVTFYSPNLRGVTDFVGRYVAGTPLLYHDDLWIGFFLFKQGVRIRQVKRQAGKDRLIYTQVLPNDVLSGATDGQLARANIYKESMTRLLRTGGLSFTQRSKLATRKACDRIIDGFRRLAGRMRKLRSG